ncbi:RNA binding S1 domain protein, partial [human gut metagenome]
ERTNDMIELGRVQELMVVREKNFGVYLGQKKDDAAAVLLPKKQVPEGTKVGDKLKVFIYKDSEDRLIATTSMPKLELGGTAVLKVKDVSKIGAFLDMGLEKDLLLPFKEQVRKTASPAGEAQRASNKREKINSNAQTSNDYASKKNESSRGQTAQYRAVPKFPPLRLH